MSMLMLATGAMTTVNRLYKYSTLLLLFFTSGLLYLIVGQIDNDDYRYKVFDIFQFGTSQLFKIVDWKFQTDKDNTIWVSNYSIAPTVNFLSSVVWTGLFLLTISRLKSKTENDLSTKFWRRVFFTNLTLSLFFFLLWLLFMDSVFLYEGAYNDREPSVFRLVFDWLFFVFYIPSFIPNSIGSLTLEQGGDTIQGYHDMYLITKVSTAFVTTVWAITGTFIYDKIESRANKTE